MRHTPFRFILFIPSASTVALCRDTSLIESDDFVEEHFEMLETFLNVRIGKNKKIPKQFQRVIRSRSSGFWQDWFTEEDLKYYGDLFDPFLKQYGYGTVITQRESKQINPAHGSQYVKKIVNERRQREGLSTI